MSSDADEPLVEIADNREAGRYELLHDGEVVGQVTTACWAHTAGCAMAMGYVRGSRDEIAARIAAGGFEVEIACQAFEADAAFDAPLARRRASRRA